MYVLIYVELLVANHVYHNLVNKRQALRQCSLEMCEVIVRAYEWVWLVCTRATRRR